MSSLYPTSVKRALVPLAGALLSAALLTACNEAPKQGAQGGGQVPEVTVMKVEPQVVTLTTELAGRTSPMQVAEVRPQVGGILKKRLFVEGSNVKAGQVLYEIDPASYQATYESAKAALAEAEANLASTRNKAERYKGLVAIKAVSQQDYDDAQAAYLQNEATVAARKADVTTARINLDYTRITAPISGRISRSEVTPGALLQANQSAYLTRVQQLDPIYVDVTRSTTELLALKRALADGKLKQVGKDKAKVKLVLEDGSAYPYDGELKFSDVVVNETTGTVNLRAEFPNPKGELLPGMYVRAELAEGVDENAILVPQKAVTRNTKGQAVAMVLNDQGKVEPRVLTTDRNIGDSWLVSAGLKAGDQVIVEGLQKVRPGSPAKAAPAAPQGQAAAAAKN